MVKIISSAATYTIGREVTRRQAYARTFGRVPRKTRIKRIAARRSYRERLWSVIVHWPR